MYLVKFHVSTLAETWKSTKWVSKDTSAREPTQEPTTLNTQQQDEPPPPHPPAALPSISMATAATAPAVGSATPYVSRSGARRLVIARHAGWFPFGTPTKTTSKNREENGASALGGRRLSATHNNQLGVGGHGTRGVGDKARGGWNMWEGGVQSLEATNSTRKKYRIKNTM